MNLMRLCGGVWCQFRVTALALYLLLSLLAGCDSTSNGNSSSAGAAGVSSSSGAGASSGSAGTSHGSTVSFPSTTSIVVHFPHIASGGTTSAGGTSGTAAAGGSSGTGSPVAQCTPDQPATTTGTGVCGDGVRIGNEACDDGNTLAGDGCSPTCQITPQLISPRIEALGEVTRLNAGSSDTIGEFGGDGFFSGGSDYAPGAVVSTVGVANAAPPEVYGSERWGDFTYTFAGLTPGAPYTVRLHFAEIWFDSVGSRIFNVAINDALVLENFDIVGVAGGPNKAVVREFNPVANASGQVVVTFTGITDNAKVNALELIPPISRAESLKRPIVQLNAGGDAVGSFGADEGFVEGGTPWTYSENVVATGGVVNAGPHEIYGSERFGNMSYTLSGLTPTALYTVRLHFAENYYTSAGSRAFDVLINDTSVLEWFDVYAVAGAHQAVVRDFSAVANDEGQVVVTFISHRDNAELNGLELLENIEQSTPSLPGRSIGAARHPLAAGCNVVGTAFAERTSDASALYFSTFKSAGQPSSAAVVAQTHVSTPDPGVAALPGDDFVVAWTDSDADELGISLRKIVGGAPQGETVIANEDPAFSQSESDIVFDGKELVVAWKDSHDPTNGPDLHYRLFSTDLKPLSGDQVLAATAAVEDNVVLAGRNGHWASAWRAGSQGMETIEVQSGSSHWTVGPFLPGATNDRPDLIFLDDTHLAVAFTRGTDPDNTGEANVPRLHAAVLDPSAPGTTESFALAPAQMPYAVQASRGQTSPSLVLASDHLLVAWRSEGKSDEHTGSELWSRRIPFTVSGDTLTLDPSHLEVPVIQPEAQREGDQDAFRMVATTLWPSGGIATVWDDAGRSLGAMAGAPDVVFQAVPDFKEPTPPPHNAYAMSDDGLYYKVNLLRRNYPGPTVSTSYQGDATYFIPQLVPEYLFDGDDSQWGYNSVSGTDPNAGATVTIDMGQYFSVGAVRLLYYYTGNAAPTQSLRLATNPTATGDWQTILNNTPGYDDHTYSFSPITARFLELKMKGAPRGLPMEIEVYPSTSSAPPTPNDGYDLGYFATLSANSSCGKPFPWIWNGGTLYANLPGQGIPPYATADCVGTYDFGEQYPISRVYTNFYVGSNWATGGRIDVAAVPGAFSNVYDSGVGNQFAYTDTMGFTFSSQPVRYVRLTDYAVPGGSPAAGILQSIQAFVTPPSRTAYFPLSADRKYFVVNSARRRTGDLQPTASVAYSNGAGVYTSNTVAQNPANVLDGDDLALSWLASSGTQSTATATITVDLGQVQPIGAVRQLYSGLMPLSYSVRAAQSLSGPWTQLVTTTAVPTYDITSSFDAISARYVEFTATGTPSVGIVSLRELLVYPPSALNPAPSSSDHLDLTYLAGMSPKVDANMGRSGGARIHSMPGGAGYYVKTSAQGGTGDATVTFDLGQQYSISEVDLLFFANQTWPGGGKIDLDDGSGTWVNVWDGGRGVPLGSVTNDGPQRITFSSHVARRIRLTGYFDSALGNGVLENIEVF